MEILRILPHCVVDRTFLAAHMKIANYLYVIDRLKIYLMDFEVHDNVKLSLSIMLGNRAMHVNLKGD